MHTFKNKSHNSRPETLISQADTIKDRSIIQAWFQWYKNEEQCFLNATHLNDYLQHWYWHSSPSLVKITNDIDLHWMIIFDRFRTPLIRHNAHWHIHDRATWYWGQTLVWQLLNTRTKSARLSTILWPVVFWWQRRALFIHMRVRIHRIVSR